ncbi:periplasmic heavy metal sensor [Octadecabacter sp. R77987]|uniref:periplasmic heavy metal sensor n=1 Tax=Octadecabacter sp. R77987 TaxID=3093874 RepID=UPI00366FDBC9
MASDNLPPRNAIGRKTRIVLVISLALNLLVVGVVAGGLLSGRGGDGRRVDLSLGPYARALDPSDVSAIRTEMRGRGPDLRRDRRAMIEDTRNFVAALRADPYDAETAAEILSRQRGRVAQFQALGQELVLDRIARMSVEGRAAFADRLEQEMGRNGGARDN